MRLMLYLDEIYHSFPGGKGFKVPGKGYNALPWILQGPGHLIPGLRNHFPGKGNYQEELGD